jgi:hypothetical protein
MDGIVQLMDGTVQSMDAKKPPWTVYHLSMQAPNAVCIAC